MKLMEDKVARRYVTTEVMRIWPGFGGSALVLLPIVGAVSWALFTYDTERPHAWKIALLGPLLMWLVFRFAPLALGVFRNEWTLEGGGIQLKGETIGRIDAGSLAGWQVRWEEKLPGYYRLAVRAKEGRFSLLLRDGTYPMESVRHEMVKRFGVADES